MKKIAFCFLICDKLNNEKIWNYFLKNIPETKYSIYIHYKEGANLKYFDKYKLNTVVETAWGDISIIKAQNLLLDTALKDKDNKHFIFVSHCCLPLKNFDYIYNNLDETKSFFNIINYNLNNIKNKNDLSNYVNNTMAVIMPTVNLFRDFSSTNIIKLKQEYKNVSQWCILNRKHAKLMINKTAYIEKFKDIPLSDELCYIYNMTTFNLLSEMIVQETTFVNMWKSDYKYNNNFDLITLVSRAFRPKEYNKIEHDELLYLLNKPGLFFGRKFDQDCIGINTKLYYKAIKSI